MRNVLIVEDNEDHALLLMDAIKRADPDLYVIRTADGRNALNYLHGEGMDPNIGIPDLIILDIRIPYVDGKEVLMRLRLHESTMHVPVVIFSVLADASEVAHCYRLGANSFVSKPVGLDQLRQVVASMVDYWLHVSLTPGRMGEA